MFWNSVAESGVRIMSVSAFRILLQSLMWVGWLRSLCLCCRICHGQNVFFLLQSTLFQNDFGVALPAMMFGILSVVAGLYTSLLLPETPNKTLPDRIHDARNFERYFQQQF